MTISLVPSSFFLTNRNQKMSMEHLHRRTSIKSNIILSKFLHHPGLSGGSHVLHKQRMMPKFDQQLGSPQQQQQQQQLNHNLLHSQQSNSRLPNQFSSNNADDDLGKESCLACMYCAHNMNTSSHSFNSIYVFDRFRSIQRSSKRLRNL